MHRNLIAVLIVITFWALLILLAGCSSIKMERQDGANYEKITVRAPPKNFTALDFTWHGTRLKAGEAATAEQPWADVVQSYSNAMQNMWRGKSIGSTETETSVAMDGAGTLFLYENGRQISQVRNWCEFR